MNAPRAAAALVIAVAVAALALALARWLTPLAAADAVFADVLTAAFLPPEPQSARVAVVVLDEDGFAGLACRSPVDRAFLADLVGRLEAAGVRAIGLDILFDQPTVPELDERLRRRILDARVPVVAVTALADTPLTERQRAYLSHFLTGMAYGHANLAKDGADGAVRRHVPVGPDGTLSLPARLAALAGVPVPEHPFRIDWRGGPADGAPPFPIYPATAVGVLPAAWLAGRVVLVGTELTGVDRHRTPLAVGGEATPGVEIEAQVLTQLLDRRVGRDLSEVGQALVALAASASGVGLALLGLPLAGLALLGMAFLGAMWLGAGLVFASGGPLVGLMAPSAAWLGAIAATTARQSWRERADRRVLMRLFANHVSAPVAEEIWRQRAAFMAGDRPRPRRMTATVLFSDVEGFTTICEALAPEPLIRWLETYLDAMVRIVAAHEGVVLRFVGDAILAVFGAPVPSTTQAEIDADAERAVRSALAMGRALATLNERWRAEGLPPVGVRIGIHTGPLVAGSLGGLGHSEYTLLGDTANTAARLEAFAKTVEAVSAPNCRIVIGDPTWRAVRGWARALAVGTVMLKGKRQPVALWLVQDEGERASPGP